PGEDAAPGDAARRRALPVLPGTLRPARPPPGVPRTRRQQRGVQPAPALPQLPYGAARWPPEDRGCGRVAGAVPRQGRRAARAARAATGGTAAADPGGCRCRTSGTGLMGRAGQLRLRLVGEQRFAPDGELTAGEG